MQLAASMNPEDEGPGLEWEPGWGTSGTEETAMTALALLEVSGSTGPAAEILLGLLRGLLGRRAQSLVASIVTGGALLPNVNFRKDRVFLVWIGFSSVPFRGVSCSRAVTAFSTALVAVLSA